MNTKLFLPIFFISLMLSLLFCGCNYGGDDDNVYIPIYQDAIYIMDADGSNKQKVIDVDNCDNVQFIPNSNKLLYLADNSLYTVNEDGTENTNISGELKVADYEYACVTSNGSYVYFCAESDRYPAKDLYGYEIFEDQVEIIYQNPLRNCQSPALSPNNELIAFSENDINSYSILEFDLTNANVDTILTIASSDFFVGLPSYKNLNTIYYIKTLEHGPELFKYDKDTGNSISLIYEVSPFPYWISNDKEKLVYINYPIIQYLQNETIIYEIHEGKEPHISNFGIIFSTSYITESSGIFFYNFITEEIENIMEMGRTARFSTDDDRIIYIGAYLTNPQRKNLITN